MDDNREEHRASRATGSPVLRERPAREAHEQAQTRMTTTAHRRVTGHTATHAPAAGERRRRVTTARPLSAADRAVVERALPATEALARGPAADGGSETDVAEKPTALVAAPPGGLLDALRTEIAAAATEARLPAVRPDRTPVTVITGANLPAVRPTPVVPRRLKPRGVTHGVGLWILGILLVVSLLSLAFPIGERLVQRPVTPRGAQLLTLRPDIAPTEPWASSAGISGLDVGGGAGPGVTAPGSAGLPVKPATTQPATPSATPPATTGILPAPVHPWPPQDPYMAVPGHPAFAVSGPNGYYTVAWGQCTWWAQNKRRDENLQHMGNAQYWASGAAARGYHVGSAPVAGATVVFQPGVQGAGGAGHVAHVEAVYPNGWFLVSEMNFYWNGGGWARVDYRYAHTGAGVAFIY